MDAQILEAAQRLRAAKQLVVLTGAGVSKESGVPTFRDAMDGLWAMFDPQQLATPDAFRRNPKLVWDWYEYRREMVNRVAPNPGHYALAELEQLIPEVIAITQNVDGFHQQAGSRDVIELHGNIVHHKCFDNCQGWPTLINLAQLTYDKDAGPPACPHCGAYVRPNVVWFTEVLPPAALERASALSQTCDVMLVVGTSGIVQPAAQLPYVAKRWGEAYLIDVNPVQDEITPMADLFLQGPSGVILPQVVAKLRELRA
jgi:NAD-dependent deacetylase